MRRLSLVLLVLTVAGCDALRDAFSARADVVARANGQSLTVDRLADLAGSGKQVPLDPLALNRLAHVWVDYSLVAQAMAKGENLRDSATMTQAMWPLVSQLKWERFHERLIEPRAHLNDAQVDSAYAAGEARLFQHILLQVPSSAAPPVDAQKHALAERVSSQARSAGAGFSRLATRYSEDATSKARGGSLGVSERGQFVQAFEDAAWQLGPGAVSPVVKSPFGYHIIRRPPLSEVRDVFATGIEDRATVHSDSVYLDSLTIKRHIETVSRAPQYVRAAVQDLEGSRSSNQVLVKYRGGSLRVRNLVRWLSALDPQIMQALPQATDEQINQFLKAIAQRELLLEQADSARVTLNPDDVKQIRAEHDSAITLLGSIVNLTPEVLRDSAGKTPQDRVNFAMGRVNDYLDRVLHGRARFFPLPPFLGELLRAQASWKVDEAGVRRAVERAQEIRADSLKATAAPRMNPAPGPAPIDTTPRRTLR